MPNRYLCWVTPLLFFQIERDEFDLSQVHFERLWFLSTRNPSTVSCLLCGVNLTIQYEKCHRDLPVGSLNILVTAFDYFFIQRTFKTFFSPLAIHGTLSFGLLQIVVESFADVKYFHHFWHSVIWIFWNDFSFLAWLCSEAIVLAPLMTVCYAYVVLDKKGNFQTVLSIWRGGQEVGLLKSTKSI